MFILTIITFLRIFLRFTKKIYLNLKNNAKRSRKVLLLNEENVLQEIAFDYTLFTGIEYCFIYMFEFEFALNTLCLSI